MATQNDDPVDELFRKWEEEKRREKLMETHGELAKYSPAINQISKMDDSNRIIQRDDMVQQTNVNGVSNTNMDAINLGALQTADFGSQARDLGQKL